MMPETYTQEQIDEAMKFLRGITSDSETMNSSIMILLSALSTAEQERDAALARCKELVKVGNAAIHVKWREWESEYVGYDRYLKAIKKWDAIVGKKEG